MTTPSSYVPGAGEGPVTVYTGTYPATVVNNNDPLGVGRLQLNIPMVLANAVSTWAVPVGTYYTIPDIGTALPAVFLGGDPTQPAWHTGPLDLAPVVLAAAPPSVTYSASQPADPRVNDVWYQIIAGVQVAPQVWTFNPGTSTFSWVTQVGVGAAGVNGPSIIAGVINGSTITGTTINGGTFNGTNYVENSHGMFIYTGTPAAGNLYMSVANTAGNDAAWTSGAGNNYTSGIAVYGTSGARAGMDTFNSGSDTYSYYTPGGQTHMVLPPQIAGGVGNAGTTTEFTGLDMYSGSNASGHDSEILLFTGNNDGSTSGNGNLYANGVIRLIWDALGVRIYTPGGMVGNPAITLFDNTVDTNANNGTQPCTMQWSIPANDAQVGTIYEVSTQYNGTIESTGIFAFKPSLNNSSLVTSGGDGVAAGTYSAATNFNGVVRVWMQILTTGVSGTANVFLEGNLGPSGNRSTSTTVVLSSQVPGQAINTTVANTLAINSEWLSNVTGQTVSTYGSMFTRKCV